jgi:hypothetical protein
VHVMMVLHIGREKCWRFDHQDACSRNALCSLAISLAAHVGVIERRIFGAPGAISHRVRRRARHGPILALAAALHSNISRGAANLALAVVSSAHIPCTVLAYS